MKNFLIIASLLVAILLLTFVLVRNNIKGSIDGFFNSFNIKNVRGTILEPIADIDVKFDIVNNSKYSFTLNELTVKIFNNENGDFLTENKVKTNVIVPIGKSEHSILLKDNKIIPNLKTFLEGTIKYKVEVSFKVWGLEIGFEEIIKL